MCSRKLTEMERWKLQNKHQVCCNCWQKTTSTYCLNELQLWELGFGSRNLHQFLPHQSLSKYNEKNVNRVDSLTGWLRSKVSESLTVCVPLLGLDPCLLRDELLELWFLKDLQMVSITFTAWARPTHAAFVPCVCAHTGKHTSRTDVDAGASPECLCVNEETRVCVRRKEGMCAALNELEMCEEDIEWMTSGLQIKTCRKAFSHTDIFFLCVVSFSCQRVCSLVWSLKCVTSRVS